VGPLARYERELESGVLTPDAEQRNIMQRLDTLANELSQRTPWQANSNGILSKLFKSKSKKTLTPVKGLYLWGGVGRGKTHLCDLFFDALPFEDKTRLHFHGFMKQIHDDLRALGQVENPIPLVADQWAMKSRLLLLDEIHVNDITDAMLLGTLLTELFARGVSLVTTSNRVPDDLYKDGLQRDRFLPAIAQLKQHTHVVEMLGETDYRLRLLQTEPIYLVCNMDNGRCDRAGKAAMQAHFDRLIIGTPSPDKSLTINSRKIPVVAVAGDVVWLTFDTLCNTPRSTNDYIELARTFTTMLLSDVLILDETRNDAARRLVNLVDELYDQRVNLIVSAEAEPNELYTGTRLEFEFVRAASRLVEMQTVDYLSQGRALAT
jgi:cell division protein ZapE